MLTALWRVLPLAPHLPKEASSVILSARLITESHAFGKLFRPLASERFGDEAVLSILNGCPTVSGIALPDHAKHTSGDEFVSINTFRDRPIPPHPE